MLTIVPTRDVCYRDNLRINSQVNLFIKEQTISSAVSKDCMFYSFSRAISTLGRLDLLQNKIHIKKYSDGLSENGPQASP